MMVKESLKGLTPYQPGKPVDEVKRELGLEKVVKLASNENPYGCSPLAKEAISRALQDVAVYPDGYAQKLRTKVAGRLNVSEKQLLFGNGSDEVILILCRALLSKGDNIVAAVPTFPQYRHNAVIEGAEVKEVPLVNGEHDLEGMKNAIDEKTKIVFVCNPNNPTGNAIGKEAFESFLKSVPEDVIVVSDEAYNEYVTLEDYPDTVPMISGHRNLVVLRTFSKAYGLASLRIGYGVGDETFMQSLDPAREPFNTSTIAQMAAYYSLDDDQFIEDCSRKNRDGIELFEKFCREHGLHCYPSQGNFILIDLGVPGTDIFNRLLKAGYIVRNGEALGFPTSARITIGTREQNEEMIAELKSLLAE
ncbi:histidinol-phosphate transaminase [Alteribacter natronophilus]|uniref:histidinol-phosphate transaminase n=1 Tax=Alteribacter natronophilus TaxID=2583810 RepID=UPI00110EC641|nr:histidinol-phosphate transaminase [Alteribacter natronophilus]TMW74098.1 histidinol-phosphate transaminase [Alteribacter natronophilus]